jgi:hypothetical protein
VLRCSNRAQAAWWKMQGLAAYASSTASTVNKQQHEVRGLRQRRLIRLGPGILLGRELLPERRPELIFVTQFIATWAPATMLIRGIKTVFTFRLEHATAGVVPVLNPQQAGRIC